MGKLTPFLAKLQAVRLKVAAEKAKADSTPAPPPAPAKVEAPPAPAGGNLRALMEKAKKAKEEAAAPQQPVPAQAPAPAQAEAPPVPPEPAGGLTPPAIPLTTTAPQAVTYSLGVLPPGGMGIGLSKEHCEVTAVKPDLPAARFGIPIGARIASVNGVPVQTSADFGGQVKAAVAAGAPIVLTLKPGSSGVPIEPQPQQVQPAAPTAPVAPVPPVAPVAPTPVPGVPEAPVAPPVGFPQPPGPAPGYPPLPVPPGELSPPPLPPMAAPGLEASPPPLPVPTSAYPPPLPHNGPREPTADELNSIEMLVGEMAVVDDKAAFERKVREKQNPLFAFLEPGHPLHDFFRFRLGTVSQALSLLSDVKGELDSKPAETPAPAPAVEGEPASNGGNVEMKLQAKHPSSAADPAQQARSLSGPGTAHSAWSARDKLEKEAEKLANKSTTEPTAAPAAADAPNDEASRKAMANALALNLPMPAGTPGGAPQPTPIDPSLPPGGPTTLTDAQRHSMRRNVPRMAVMHSFVNGRQETSVQIADCLATQSTRTEVGRKVTRRRGSSASSSSSYSSYSSSSSSSSYSRRRRSTKKRRRRSRSTRSRDRKPRRSNKAEDKTPAPTGGATNSGLPPEGYTCSVCGKRGHWSSDCPLAKASTVSVPPPSYKCRICGGTGHWAKDCPNKKPATEKKGEPGIPAGYKCRICKSGDHWTAACPNQVEKRDAPRGENRSTYNQPRPQYSRGSDTRPGGRGSDTRTPVAAKVEDKGDKDCVISKEVVTIHDTPPPKKDKSEKKEKKEKKDKTEKKEKKEKKDKSEKKEKKEKKDKKDKKEKKEKKRAREEGDEPDAKKPKVSPVKEGAEAGKPQEDPQAAKEPAAQNEAEAKVEI